MLDAYESPGMGTTNGSGVYRLDARNTCAGVAHADVLRGDGSDGCYRHRGGYRHLCHEYGGIYQ